MPSERNDAPSRTDRCRECDRAVTPGANFCPGCGADLRAAESRDDDASAAYTGAASPSRPPPSSARTAERNAVGGPSPRQPAP